MKKHLFLYMLCMIPNVVCADFDTSEKIQVNSLYYFIDNDNHTAEVTQHIYYGGYYGNIKIPSSFEYNNMSYSVTSIRSAAFLDNSELESIEIPKSISSVGDIAFSGCSNLTTIKVELENTFYDSRDNCNAIIETKTNKLIAGFQNSIIPNSVTSIGNHAFYRCEVY